mmetsp:Transcript_20296/g.45301  ORF Transcript_20296/g.45301 Transcript_20296/m.45301 type:complete len:204 (+) Transcript_20296:368-979(+)
MAAEARVAARVQGLQQVTVMVAVVSAHAALCRHPHALRQRRLRHQRQSLANAQKLDSAHHRAGDRAGWESSWDRLAVLIETKRAIVTVHPHPDPVPNLKSFLDGFLFKFICAAAIQCGIIRAQIPRIGLVMVTLLDIEAFTPNADIHRPVAIAVSGSCEHQLPGVHTGAHHLSMTSVPRIVATACLGDFKSFGLHCLAHARPA